MNCQKAAVLPLMFLLCGTPAYATDYYVDIKGSDKGNGTKSSPWSNVKKALSSVAPNLGHTIRVGPGTFDLGGKFSVPSGVKLVGSGVGSTTIMGSLELIKFEDVTIRNLKFDGKNYKYGTSIIIRDGSQLRLHDIAFNGYATQAINIQRVSDGKIYNTTITDSSYNKRIAGGGGNQSSTISLGNLTNFELDNIKIDTTTRGGAGITSGSDAWPLDKPWSGPSAVLKNVKFSNLDIKVDKWHAWGNGSTPQLALELWHQTCHKCEIHSSTFNSTVSLATDNSTSIRVHHNLWQGPNNPFYAIEAASDNLEIDHNYIRGGSYPIATFGKNIDNLNVHHNIFEKTKAPFLVGHFKGKINNFEFVNNTVYINSNAPLFYFNKGDAANQEIRNNIFYSSIGNIGNKLGASAGVDNNLFFNIDPVGSRAMTFDPQLTLSGSSPSSYYKLKTGSLAANLGAIPAGAPAWDNRISVDDNNNDTAVNNNNNGSSRSSVNKATNPNVPEPLTILGSLTALGLGVSMCRRFRKKA